MLPKLRNKDSKLKTNKIETIPHILFNFFQLFYFSNVIYRFNP